MTTFTFARTDNSVVGRWWWTVDRWAVIALTLLIIMGLVLTLAASPAVAERIGVDPFHFVRRQVAFLVPSIAAMFVISLMNVDQVRRLACFAFVLTLAALAATLVIGAEIKGSRRWIGVGSLSVQPSEFVKPAFIVVSGWLLAERQRHPGFPGGILSVLAYLAVVAILLMQPDFGQTLLVSMMWGTQLFVAGLPMVIVFALAGLATVGIVGGYLLLPHVASRIDRFLNPEAGDTYQVDRSMDAFMSGGLWGRGPGEGTVKRILPDAHTDFIFAVAGEEFGMIACLALVLLFAFIVLRLLARLLQETDSFVVYAGTGLVCQFGLQAFINMGVNLHLLPAKGMTLPFISYGGSSMLALAFGMGMLLALSRTRPGLGGYR
ncbi:putative lipid II flippase FtsW [Zavarzinia aquatilis]|uniref:Probable peptidoglycan glycosyltransferase FtsW n=1 Tax=Zavarzinia aquatilis TaxID=2211142 RepID=A0A317EEM3_9PROT|nr:putative lipid II flippase FtsW [Zavarzinia aquatilis]PWR24726.1 putative lipid II flippase FtsW [Zavarzinia aquatilis]